MDESAVERYDGFGLDDLISESEFELGLLPVESVARVEKEVVSDAPMEVSDR